MREKERERREQRDRFSLVDQESCDIGLDYSVDKHIRQKNQVKNSSRKETSSEYQCLIHIHLYTQKKVTAAAPARTPSDNIQLCIETFG